MARSIGAQDLLKVHDDTRSNPLLTWVFEHIEEQQAPSGRMSYQQRLRAIGAWLDIKHACNVNLIESPTGFIIRYGIEQEPLMLHTHLLTHTELERLDTAMKERRSLHPSGRYQDFLRAMGYEIDEQVGTYLVLDEIEEQYFITFCYRSTAGGLAWIKGARVLSSGDQAAILRRAYARRKQPEMSKRFWRRSRSGPSAVTHARRTA